MRYLAIDAATLRAGLAECERLIATDALRAVTTGGWVQPAGGEWDYAQEGLSTLQVEPGDSIALLFTLNGEPAAPTS